MKSLIYILVVLAWLPTAISYGQADKVVNDVIESEREKKLDSLINDLFMDDPAMKSLLNSTKPWHMNYLYYRSSLSTKTISSGREIGDNQVNLGNQLFYLNGAGFYMGLSGVWYSQLDPGYRTTVLMGGYSNNLFKTEALRIRLSYQRYVSHISDPLYQPLYNQGISAGLTLKNNKVGLRVDGSLNFGDYEQGKNLSADIYGNILLYKNGARKKIRLRPEVSLSYGVDYQEFMLDENIVDPYTGIEYTSYYKDVFGLMNVQLDLPLYISYKNFDFQISYQYNMPQNFVNDIEYPNISSLQFSVGYFFRLGK